MNVSIDDNLTVFQDGNDKGKAHDVIPNHLSKMTLDNWENSLSYLAAVKLAEKVDEIRQRASAAEQKAEKWADEAIAQIQSEADTRVADLEARAEDAERRAKEAETRADELEQYRPATDDEIEKEAMKIVSRREMQEKINSRAEEIMEEKKKGKS